MFRPARPEYGGAAQNLSRRLVLAVIEPFQRFFDLLKLFHREAVFFYLLLVLLLMIFGAAVFLAIEADRQNESLLDLVVGGNYWAIVTIATLGYGDIVPKTVAGRAFTILFLYLALAIVALFTANLTSALTAKKMKEARGLNDAKNQTGHLLVLGWKKELVALLDDILRNGALSARDIVLVCDIEPEKAEEIAAFPSLAGLRLIRGQHYTDTCLKLANPKAASTILLLADESQPDANDFETDSKTVMAALALARYVHDSHVVAELLDPSHEPFLRNTKIIDEIVYPKRYANELLRLAAVNVGLVNSFNTLIGAADSRLVTYELPADLFGKTVDDLKARLAVERPKALFIGLVENTGKYAERKADALREAQLTPDMDKLVANLRRVKAMATNQPRLNPPGNTVLQPNTLAIAVERTEG